MPDEIAIELGLAMAVIANRVVEIDQTFSRHELTQAAHEFVRTFRVNAEISARKREQDRQVRFADQHRVQMGPAFFFVPQTQGKGKRCAVLSIAESATDQVRTAPAIERIADDLQRWFRERRRGSVPFIAAQCSLDPFSPQPNRARKLAPIFFRKTN